MVRTRGARMSGLSFDIKFKDVVEGPNDMLTDSGLKASIEKFFAEFWFMVLVFWLVPQPRPKSDCTEPKCPNTLALKSALLRKFDEEIVLDAEVVKAFIADQLVVHKLGEAKPSTSSEVDAAFAAWLQTQKQIAIDADGARQWLCKVLLYKAGASLAARGTRKKTSVNCYMLQSDMMTVKPKPMFAANVQALCCFVVFVFLQNK